MCQNSSASGFSVVRGSWTLGIELGAVPVKFINFTSLSSVAIVPALS
jgi:hypothetical protein